MTMPSSPSLHFKNDLTIILIIIALISLIYSGLAHHGFITFDDPDFFTENRYVQEGLTWTSIKWAFTNTDVSDWLPLTWISILIDVQLFGMNAGAHHLMNVFYHTLNTILFFFFLKKVKGSFWKAAITALIWGVHPLRVESVAWASERKDVLCMFFLLLTLFAYAHYSQKKNSKSLMLVLGLYLCSIMSKAMTMTLPVLLLLIDYWPLERFKTENFRKLFIEKIPFGVIAIGAALLAYIPKYSRNYMSSFADLSPLERVANSMATYMSYLGKTFWPHPLAVFYPYAENPYPTWMIASSIFFLIAMSYFSVRKVKMFPYLFVGWFWFLASLVPVMGWVRCTNFIMADRYTYIPHLGLFIAVVWGLSDFFSRWKLSRKWIGFGSVLLISSLSSVAWRQTSYWKDDVILNEHAIEVAGDNDQVRNNLGLYYENKGMLKEAAHHYSQSLRMNPSSLDVMNNAANILLRSGKPKEAMTWYAKILSENPSHRNALINLGLAHRHEKQFSEAESYLKRAIQVDAKTVKAYVGLADLSQQQQKLDASWDYIQAALALDPQNEEANYIAANLKVASKSYQEAKPLYERVLKKNPNHFKAAMNLANLDFLEGDLEKAVQHYKKALELEPRFLLAHINLGKTYMKLGDFFSAHRHYEEVLRFSPGNQEVQKLLEEAKHHRDQSQTSWPLSK